MRDLLASAAILAAIATPIRLFPYAAMAVGGALVAAGLLLALLQSWRDHTAGQHHDATSHEHIPEASHV